MALMEQYAKIKERQRGRILLYRVGEFYEMFYEDAERVSKALDLTLTTRKSGRENVPMCGIPCRSLDKYLLKLVSKGFSAAVCEQTSKSKDNLLEREVVQVVTQGTAVEDELLENSKPNYIACTDKDLSAIAWADISTGHFLAMEGTEGYQILDKLQFLDPKEVILEEPIDDNILPPATALVVDEKLFSRNAPADFPMGGIASRSILKVCSALLAYLSEVRKESLSLLSSPSLVNQNDKMYIDPSTWTNLEILKSAAEKKGGTLLAALDKTLTSGGARLLRNFLREPLAHRGKIEERLGFVQFFLDHDKLTRQAGEYMESLPDIERILTRVHFHRTSPQELGRLRDGMKSVSMLHLILRDKGPISPLLPKKGVLHGGIINLLVRSLRKESLPGSHKEGGFIEQGYDKRLDSLRKTIACLLQEIDALEDECKRKISQIRLYRGSIAGFYFEVPARLAPNVGEGFLHKQTLGRKCRYTTEKLMRLEMELIQAEQKAINLEALLFREILDHIKEKIPAIRFTMRAVSKIDLFSSWALIARDFGYVKPVIREEANLELTRSHHPILQRFVTFQPNNCRLDNKTRIILLTGDNMGGKSTFSRQVPLTVFMCQIGCFVPAAEANIGLVDSLFCRSGCRDNIVEGKSSFLMEMMDLSRILNKATDKSLVVLDELGSGTSPAEGSAILQASLEYIREIGCRCICVTHYSELTLLTLKVKGVQNMTLDGKYKIAKGSSSFSHALSVAKSAGIPSLVVERAKELLGTS